MLKKIMIGLVIAMVAVGVAHAEVPHLINFQGRLTQDGAPLTGPQALSFALVGSAQNWARSNIPAELDQNGVFSVNLDITVADLEGATDLRIWLGDIVMGEPLGQQPLTSVPYALVAETLAGGAAGIWETDGVNVWRPSGNVGIGTTDPDPDARLTVNGALLAKGALTVNSTSLTKAKFENPNSTDYMQGIQIGGKDSGGSVDYFEIGVDIQNKKVGLGIPTGADKIVGAADLSKALLVLDDTMNRVGIGTAEPRVGLEVKGNIFVNGTANNYFAGNVGIGTSSPDKQLVITTQTDNGTVGIKFEENGGTDAAQIQHVGSHSNGYLEIEDYSSGWNTVGLVIKQGKVGIGTAAPTGTLHVHRMPGEENIMLTRPDIAQSRHIDIGSNGYLYITRTGAESGDDITIDNGGKVGINRTDPDYILHVQDTSSNNFTTPMAAMTPNIGSGQIGQIRIGRAPSTKNCAQFGYKHSGTSGSDDNLLTMGLYGVDNALVINGQGNVGIGTENPTTRLDVSGNILAESTAGTGIVGKGPSGGVYGIDTTDDLAYGYLGSGDNGVYGRSDRTYGKGVRGYSSKYWGVWGTGLEAGVRGDSSGGVGVYGSSSAGDGLEGYSSSGSHSGVYGHAIGTNSTGGTFVGDLAGVYAKDETTDVACRLGYGNYGVYSYGKGYFSGSVGVACTPSESLDVNGNVRFRNVVEEAGYYLFGLTSDGRGRILASDRRLKTNLQPLKGSLSKVMQLQGYSFDWKNSPELGRDVGLIAQDVREIYPELVPPTSNEDQMMAVRYLSLTAVLVEAIKELKAENDALRADVEALKAAK